jgi:hypothetical protein
MPFAVMPDGRAAVYTDQHGRFERALTAEILTSMNAQEPAAGAALLGVPGARIPAPRVVHHGETVDVIWLRVVGARRVPLLLTLARVPSMLDEIAATVAALDAANAKLALAIGI